MNLLRGLDVSKTVADFRTLLVEIRDLLIEVRDYQRAQSETAEQLEVISRG